MCRGRMPIFRGHPLSFRREPDRYDAWGNDTWPPRPEEEDYWRSMQPAHDELVPLHLSVADGSWGESSDEADGEA